MYDLRNTSWMYLNDLSAIEDYWVSLGSERTGGRLRWSTETPDSNCARAEDEILQLCHEILQQA